MAMKYLLDTSICVFFLRGKHDIRSRILKVNSDNCYISEVTVAELKYGVECSSSRSVNRAMLEEFLSYVNVIPFTQGIEAFAEEKSRLRKEGTPVENFDLFIGCTALSSNMILVTDNTRHFERIRNLVIENWVQR